MYHDSRLVAYTWFELFPLVIWHPDFQLELYLRRPPAKHPEYRIDRILKRKAEQGVKIFIIVYKVRNRTNTRHKVKSFAFQEVTQGMQMSSRHTKVGAINWKD